jgi:hypothetical protein
MLLGVKMQRNIHIRHVLYLKVSFIICCIVTSLLISAAIFSAFSVHSTPKEDKSLIQQHNFLAWLLDIRGAENNLPSELPTETDNLIFDDDTEPPAFCLASKIYTNSYGFDKQFLLLNNRLASLFKPEFPSPPPKILG